jgi:hypothetical protein
VGLFLTRQTFAAIARLHAAAAQNPPAATVNVRAGDVSELLNALWTEVARADVATAQHDALLDRLILIPLASVTRPAAM